MLLLLCDGICVVQQALYSPNTIASTSTCCSMGYKCSIPRSHGLTITVLCNHILVSKSIGKQPSMPYFGLLKSTDEWPSIPYVGLCVGI